MKIVRNKNRDRRGAAVIEFAVVSPLLFLLVLGMFEVGRFVNVGEIATAAARFGAREASLSGATVASVQTRTLQYLTSSGVNSAAATVTVENESTVGSGAFGVTGNLSTVPVGAAIRIRVDVNFAQVTWVPGGFFGGVLPANVSGISIMRKEST